MTPQGQPQHEIFAESERTFFTTIVDALFTFDVDGAGPAKAMTLTQAAAALPANALMWPRCWRRRRGR